MLSSNTILFAISFLMIISSLPGGAAFSQSVPFETVDRGETSYFNYGAPDFLGADMVTRDQNTWTWFWMRHTQGLQPEPPIPRIEFRREMVLAVLLGFQASGGGPSIEITSIEEIQGNNHRGILSSKSSENIRVFVKNHREPGSVDVITNPYHIVRVTGNHPSVIFEHEPRAKTCTENADCTPNEYCEKNFGDCDGTGACKSKPEACSMIYDPVCGCDGKTYGNRCMAASEGVSIFHQGSCEVTISCMKNEDCGSYLFCLFPEGVCSGPGTCTARPTVCPLIACIFGYGVCGCDGKTYCNLCEAYANGISILKTEGCSVEQGSIGSGGTITSALCCQSVADFPNTCAIGACGCAPQNSHQVNTCACGSGNCFDGSKCVPLAAP